MLSIRMVGAGPPGERKRDTFKIACMASSYNALEYESVADLDYSLNPWRNICIQPDNDPFCIQLLFWLVNQC